MKFLSVFILVPLAVVAAIINILGFLFLGISYLFLGLSEGCYWLDKHLIDPVWVWFEDVWFFK